MRELRGVWKKRAPTDVRKAAESGLRWLEEHQEKSGLWDSDKHGGQPLFDPGVTGLALWALLGAGVTDSATVRHGLDYLLKTQDTDGVIGSQRSHSFQSYHAFATIALAEGANVEPATYDGVARWIDSMTDPVFGQIGYNYPGGSSARPEGRQEIYLAEKSQAMTAAGAWCRQLLGGAAHASETLPKSIELCMRILPTWNLGGRDQLYHQFGSLAVYQHDAKAWRKWEKALRKVYVAAQETNGSWPPTGVWGGDGGRVYSTAMAVLSLLTPYRYPPGFAAKPRQRAHEAAAIRALRAARKDDNPEVAAAAKRALQRIGPRE